VGLLERQEALYKMPYNYILNRQTAAPNVTQLFSELKWPVTVIPWKYI